MGVRIDAVSAVFAAIVLLTVSRRVSAVDFLFNGFKSTDVSLTGDTVVELPGVIKLTNDSVFSMGHALYPSPIETTNGYRVLPFSTSFVFAISKMPDFSPGHGLALFFSPALEIRSASPAQNLGLFNWSSDGRTENHIFAIEFDVFQNAEFADPDNNHVGVDVNSLTSLNATPAGYWPDNSTNFAPLCLNDGTNYQAWIDFSGFWIDVTMAPAGIRKPVRPLISMPLNLTGVLGGKMFVGFSASTGRLVESHRILAWSFSNSNSSIGDGIITTGLPSFIPLVPRGKWSKKKIGIVSSCASILALIAAVTIAATIRHIYLKRKAENDKESWELEFWPHRIPYHKLKRATKGFSEENLLKEEGNGRRVFKGILRKGGVEIAVKCFNHKSNDGMSGFLAEICSFGRLKHRSLVGLRGWCKEGKQLMLVFDFMKNGSVEDWIFGDRGSLDWRTRTKILRDVGYGVLYLHHGCESKVLHRDIKASNVMLDSEMNGRLGDFGLARLYEHGQAPHTTCVVGTVGYMAPEVVRSGKASIKTDIYGFGVLMLEVVCGRRPIEEGHPGLVEWLKGLVEEGEILLALDHRFREGELALGVDLEEAERILQLGLLCTSADPCLRPTMKQVMWVLDRDMVGDDESQEPSQELRLFPWLKSTDPWSDYAKQPVFPHPTYDQVRGSTSCSVELSESDIILEGR